MLLSTRSQYTGTSNMGITVGIGTDGKIVGITLTSYTESKDFTAKNTRKLTLEKIQRLSALTLWEGSHIRRQLSAMRYLTLSQRLYQVGLFPRTRSLMRNSLMS